MLYPFKFNPVFKDYIWGGRELEKLGKRLPEGITAESWEISTHPDGISSIANGEFRGQLLTDLIDRFEKEILGTELYTTSVKFPLLIKFIDANKKLSVQVHPRDEYARSHENGELGKNEMWYILAAKPGAKLVYGTRPGITKPDFRKAVEEDRIGECLNEVEVFPGDVLNIPAGLIHAIEEGIVLAEIQQNSNTTYRVFDYNRVDSKGNKRPLHIEKALDVIDFNLGINKAKTKGLDVKLNSTSTKSYKIANKYFSVEEYDVNGDVEENADGSKFYIYVFVDGAAEILYNGGKIEVAKGESILVPAALGKYTIEGKFKALKTYVPDIKMDIEKPLLNSGYSKEDIFKNVAGVK
ncbi:MAG: mannose-6-phosphate isomerase, class [Clostridiales bacterium]|nr:mannose-6-phosphate isomerase, class [Clostridiales bacterium]